MIDEWVVYEAMVVDASAHLVFGLVVGDVLVGASDVLGHVFEVVGLPVGRHEVLGLQPVELLAGYRGQCRIALVVVAIIVTLLDGPVLGRVHARDGFDDLLCAQKTNSTVRSVVCGGVCRV